MSSPTHPTPSDVDEEYAFSSANILDYTSTLPNYFPATLGNISSDFSENSKNDENPPVSSPFYNNLYHKNMQAFYAKESPIPPQAPITPPAILTPSPEIEERLVNGWIIIPRDFDEVKTKLKEARTQIIELQNKHMGQRDKIAFYYFRISDLEMTLEDIQDHHQLYMKNLMGHTS
ncbi:hypothetical protein Tco_0728105 [Tanacetum coccineum]|uniref:Uncharacterized protein n=1 Tax=Tanacetum coccineum TaxID=301880 RepID=A0ABQ4YK72_9ASTR